MKLRLRAPARHATFTAVAISAAFLLLILVVLIGQTYGAVSALLTALALAGVVISLLYQARDVRTSREQAMLTIHHELIRMEMSDPLYMTAIGAPWGLPIPSDQDSIREHIYVGMWVTYWERLYIMGEMLEDSVRLLARRELFNGRPGRELWQRVGELRLSHSKGRDRHFNNILNEEYHKAITSQPIAAAPVIASQMRAATDSSPFQNRRIRGIGRLFLAVAAGVLADRLLNRRVNMAVRDVENAGLHDRRTGHRDS
jgi:hypothetical protein